jgi:hypothetical protein
MAEDDQCSSFLPVACATEDWFESTFCVDVEAGSPGELVLATTDEESESEFLIERYLTHLHANGTPPQVIELPCVDPVLATNQIVDDGEWPLRALRSDQSSLVILRGIQFAPKWYLDELVGFLAWFARCTMKRVLMAPVRRSIVGIPKTVAIRIVDVPSWQSATAADQSAVFEQLLRQAVEDSDAHRQAEAHVRSQMATRLQLFDSRAALRTELSARLVPSTSECLIVRSDSIRSRADLDARFKAVLDAIEQVDLRFQQDLGYRLVEQHHHTSSPFAAADLWSAYLATITALYVRICDYPGRRGLCELSTRWSVSADKSRMTAVPDSASRRFIDLLRALRAWAQHGLDPNDRTGKKTLDTVRIWHRNEVETDQPCPAYGRRLCHALLNEAASYERALRALATVPIDRSASDELRLLFQRWKREPSDHWISETVREIIREENLRLDPDRVSIRINNDIRGWIKSCVLPDADFSKGLCTKLRDEILKLAC